jgi:TonB family protein
VSRRRCFRSIVAGGVVLVTAIGLAPPARAQSYDQPLPAPPPREAPPAPKLTKPPAVRKQVEPAYPPEAFAAGLSGDVTMAVDLDAEGRVTSVAVTKGAGHGFDEAAVAAVEQMEFSPAEVDGKPSPIRFEYTIHFQPKVVPPPEQAAPVEPPVAPPPPPEAPAPEPPVILRGRMRERGTREPVVGADVAIIVRTGPAAPLDEGRAEIVAATDQDGRFEVRARAPEGLRVVVSESGHEPCIRDFAATEVNGAMPADWTCFARSRTESRYETRVRAEAAHPEETKQTLSKAELTTVPGTMGDPLRVVQNLPGVARSPFGLGLLIVRGADPQDTGVFIEGQPIPQLYHFLVGPSVFTSNLIDKIDFYPGGFGARYGRFSGGAVDVGTRTSLGRELHGSADVNLLDSSAFVEGPVSEHTHASLSFRRSYIDEILPFFIPKKIGSTFVTAVPVYYDYQGRLDHDLRSGGRLTLMVFGSNDSLDIVAQDPTRQLTSDTTLGFHRVMGIWSTTFGGWTSRFSPTYGYGNQDITLGPFSGFQRYHRLYLREDVFNHLAPSFTLAAGLDVVLSYDWAVFHAPFPRDGRTLGRTLPDVQDVSRSLYDTAPSAYLEAEWDLRPNLRVVPGVRFDYYHVVATDKYDVDPRLSARWALTPRLALKASAGVYHQLPTPQFLDSQFGNPNLALIWSDQYQIGVERRFTDAIDGTATLFYVRRHNLPEASVDHFSSIGLGRAYGLEVLLRHQVSEHFFGWIAYTLSKSEEKGFSAMGIPMGMQGMPQNSGGGADQPWHPTQFDQTHNLIIVGSYRRHGWEFGARYRLVTGNPTTPVNGSLYDADFNGYTPVNGAPLSARLPTFSQLDLRLEHTWTFNYWVLGVYLDVQNVFNSENPEGVLYDYRFQESAPIRGLPILPILGVRGRF